eukprot:gene3408-4236_t
MLVRYDRPVSRSAFLARRLALFALGMLVVVVLAHRFGPLATPDFVLLVLACALPSVIGLGVLVQHFYQREQLQSQHEALATARTLAAAIGHDVDAAETTAL